MKKILFVVALLGVFVFSASAGFNANVFGGYTTVSMAKVNTLLRTISDVWGSPPDFLPDLMRKLLGAGLA